MIRTIFILSACLEAAASGSASPELSDIRAIPAVHSSSLATCVDIPGAVVLFNRPEIHVVWVGEQHGTNEMPAFLADLACLAGAQDRPVIVALERAQDEQSAWDRFLASDGSESAVAALTAAPVWTRARDGRNSRAILAMAESLRRLKHEGRIAAVSLIDRWASTSKGLNPNHRDEEMAHAVSDIVRAQPNAMVLVYSGNVHAMKRRPNWLPVNVQTPAASYLPSSEVLSINLIGENGHHLGQFRHTRSVVPVESIHDDHDSLTSMLSEGFDALGYTGVPTTVSPPAVDTATGSDLGKTQKEPVTGR